MPGGVILLVKPSNGNVGSDLCTRDHGRDFDSRVHGQPSNPLLVIFGVYERQAEDLLSALRFLGVKGQINSRETKSSREATNLQRLVGETSVPVDTFPGGL